jgi:hypothetical protein
LSAVCSFFAQTASFLLNSGSTAEGGYPILPSLALLSPNVTGPPEGVTANSTGSDSHHLRVATWTAVLAGVVAFVLRLASFNGFPNDQFMHLAWAQQLLHGELPGRDFAEPGMPLAVALSAAAQWLWQGFLSEAVLTTAMLALAVALTCRVLTALTRSVTAGLVGGALVLAWYPRLYSYPKILVPALTMWLLVRHMRQPSQRGLVHLAVAAVVSFLLRHDLGVMAGMAIVIALLCGDGPIRQRVRHAASFVAIGALLVAPYLMFVQATEGLVEHLRVGAEFSRAEEHQLLWPGPPLTLYDGARGLGVGGIRFSAATISFWLFNALMAGLAVAALRTAPAWRAPLAALLAFAVFYRIVILRHPLEARLPDAATVAAMASLLALSWLWQTARGSRRLHWPRAAAALCAAAAFAVLSMGAMWSVANLSDRVDQAGLNRGPRGVAIQFRDVVRRWPERSWRPYWPAGYPPPVVDYITSCTKPTDRLLVTWFGPEYYVFTNRVFAAGHAMFLPSSFATTRDQASMLKRLESQPVPLVLLNDTERAKFAHAFPALAAYVDERYAVRGRFTARDGSIIAIALRNDLRPRTDFGHAPWRCDFEREVATVAAP